MPPHLTADASVAILLLVTCVVWLLCRSRRAQLQFAAQSAVADAARLRTLELLESIARQSSEVIFAKDFDGRYLYLNREGARLLGRSEAEIIGRTVQDLRLGPDAERTVAVEVRVLGGNAPVVQQETHTLAGDVRTFLVSRKPLHDAEGRVTGLLGTAHDVTDLERARASQALLAAVVESSADAIVCQDLDGTVTSANHAAERLYGFDAGEVVGLNGAAYCADPSSREARGRVTAGHVVRIPHATCRHRDGHELQVSLTLSPVRDGTGRVVAISSVARDIGECVALERELRERGDALERAQAIALLGHVVTVCGKIESYSTTLPQLLLRSEAELNSSASAWLEWVSPGERPALRERVAEAARTGTGTTLECRMQRGDGEWIDVRYVTVPLRAEGDRAPRWFGTVQDVTVQKKLEASLREAARFVEAVGDSMLSHMAVLDARGVIVSVNASWRQWAEEGEADAASRGLGCRDGVGVNYLEVCRDVAAALPCTARVAAGIDAVLRGDVAAYKHEYECASPSGKRWFALTVSPLRVDGGGAVVIHTDISDRKRAESELGRYREHLEDVVAERSAELVEANAALTDTEDFLRTLANQLPGCVAYWSHEGVCRFVNQAYCEWLGKSPAELLGFTLKEVLGPNFMAVRASHVAAVLAGQPRHFEREEIGPDGQLIVWWVHYIPDLANSEVRGFIVLANDVTVVKRTEVSLRKANQELSAARVSAEAATVAKSAFLANMSHEIRTPMNAIIGLTHLMRRDACDPLQHDRLGKVADAAQHLLGVINDILDLSKIESGKLLLENADFPTRELLSRVCALVAEPARARGLELVIDADGLPDALHGDATRLSQALLNYLSNAVKFTPAGSVRLRAEVVERDEQGVQVRFEVQDTGIGITPERLGDIFNPFEQADVSTTRRFGGTGLGLSIARQLARLMHGDAGASSEPGAGSRFWFTARLEHAVSGGRDPALVGLRVLLVDGPSDARDVLAQMLRSFGLHTHVAGDGPRALGMAEVAAGTGKPYDLHVVNRDLAGRDGVAVAAGLRAAASPRGFRSLILGAADDPEPVGDGMRDGTAEAFLARPITLLALRKALGVATRDGSRAPMAAAPPGPVGSAFDALRLTRAGARVLLAEDNPVNRGLAVELLRSANLEVDTAVDGAEAIALGQTGRHDLILMDMQMPRVDGLEAARALRATGTARRVPIVAMTANAFGEDRQACLEAGMNDHVAKPVDPEVLYATLLRWLPERSSDTRSGQLADGSRSAARPPEALAGAEIFSRLAATGDLNVARGLQHCNGQGEFYLLVLRRFVEAYDAGTWRLDAATLLHEVPALAEAAHSLRGTGASIGATCIEELAADLELLGRSGAPERETRRAARALREHLGEVIGRIRRVLDEPG